MNPQQKPEVKLELPPMRRLYPLDSQDSQTLEKFLQERKVDIYLEPSNERDYFIHNADGSITRVGACVNINGTQWIIPAGEKTDIPESVYEFLMQCPEQRRRVPQAIFNQRLAF